MSETTTTTTSGAGLRARARAGIALDAGVVAAHQRAVWRYLRFLGCPAALADDLTQDAFVALMHAELEDRSPTGIDSWLRAVARNLFRAERRAMRRGLELLEPARIEAIWIEYARADAGDAWHAALRRCLEHAAERDRRALELRYRGDASRAEIAAALDLHEEAVKTLLRRAKDRLRVCIEQRLAAAEERR